MSSTEFATFKLLTLTAHYSLLTRYYLNKLNKQGGT